MMRARGAWAGAAHLDQRVHGHAVQARQTGESSSRSAITRQCAGLRQEGGQRELHAGDAGKPREAKLQVDGKHTSCPWRPADTRPNLHMAGAAQPLTQQRADTPMPHREHHQQQRGHLLRYRAAPPWRKPEIGLRNTAPKNHIHEMPSSERNTTMLPCASFRLRQVSLDGVPVDAQAPVGVAGTLGNRTAPSPPQPPPAHAGHGHRGVPDAGSATSSPPTRGPSRWPQKCPFHHAVAAGQFALVQHLRQVGKLHRPEPRRLKAHQGTCRPQHHRHVWRRSPGGQQQHDGDLEVLHRSGSAASSPPCR